ncbi:serine hydrolase domain-containing protein [Dawidia soli]|uniref:Beta-lactamase family protein n=1 Tax=Dawidia soli TaxID=2782352 RepID=A0AAP2DD01_9BACT|nr:serine hydrolase domain-containing protein [Dawidia soli]MBT1689488.1 beta-lactamase family protein [Dawidia soli]
MKRILLILLLFPVVHTHAQSVPPAYAEAIKLLDAWFDAQVDYDRLPGISVGIVKDQELIWSKGYGKADVAKKIPAEASTLYSICSISKLFTSVAVLQLRDAGKLRLDDDVASLLPWFSIKQVYPGSAPITIRSLLTHSSGLPREVDFPYWTENNFPSKEQIIEKIKEQQTLYPASTYFQYSNLGITLLGYIVEQVSGMSYTQYVEEHILRPLQLIHTHTTFPAGEKEKVASGYSELSRKGERRPVPRFDPKGIAPAAGYTSTVEDLARFASWQFRLLEKNDDTEILRASTLKEMQQVQYMDPNWKTSWGLGFKITHTDNKTFVSHSGYCPGYQSLIILSPDDKLAFIVLINAIGTDPNKYFEGMRALFTKAEEDKPADKVDPSLTPFCGLYGGQPWGTELAVSTWGDKLATMFLPADNPKHAMILWKRTQDNTFRRIRDNGELGEELYFERDKDGGVQKLWWNSNYRYRIK